MDYLDFNLRIGAGDDRGEYPVTVIESPAGEASEVMAVASNQFWSTFDYLFAVRDGQEIISAFEDEELSAETGRDLFDLLFTGKVRESYRSSLALARSQEKGLRIRLRIEAPELAALPWELLHDDDQRTVLSLSRETPLTRYLELSRGSTALAVQPPVRILGMVASPTDLEPLAVDEETRRMELAIDHLRDGSKVELVWLQGQTVRDLQTALRDGEWHVLHFIGHGGFDAERGEGLIAFAGVDGKARMLPARKLGQLVDGVRSLRLAVFNACEGARASETDLYSSVGAVMMDKGVPAVVSMQYPITDVAALEFSRTLYDSLAKGLPVDAAVTEARNAVSFEVDDAGEWATPVLHMRSPDGQLFDLDFTGLVFPQTVSPPTPSPAPNSPKPSVRRSAATPENDGRGILLRRVRQYWVEGVLENSLFRDTMMDLGMEAMTDAVDNPWATIVERPGAESAILPADQTLADVFDDEGSSLLILGEPGAGKTTSLLKLTRALLDRAEVSATLPMPVVFTLSSWAATHATLIDWMAAELSAKYQVPKKIGKAWLEDGHVLPLLDGLDEQPQQARGDCVAAINAHVLDFELTGVVVCCRFREYVELPNRLTLNAAVRLTELRDEQVQAYMAAVGDQLAGLQLALQQRPTLRYEARSPLMLNLLVQAYQGLSVADIEQERGETVTARRQQIMGAYVARMHRRAQERQAA